jgi:hypothetical protein
MEAAVTEQRVTVTISNAVAEVRLNRPDKRNALDGAMFAGLVTAGERLKSEPGVGGRAVRCRSGLLRGPGLRLVPGHARGRAAQRPGRPAPGPRAGPGHRAARCVRVDRDPGPGHRRCDRERPGRRAADRSSGPTGAAPVPSGRRNGCWTWRAGRTRRPASPPNRKRSSPWSAARTRPRRSPRSSSSARPGSPTPGRSGDVLAFPGNEIALHKIAL